MQRPSFVILQTRLRFWSSAAARRRCFRAWRCYLEQTTHTIPSGELPPDQLVRCNTLWKGLIAHSLTESISDAGPRSTHRGPQPNGYEMRSLKQRVDSSGSGYLSAALEQQVSSNMS